MHTNILERCLFCVVVGLTLDLSTIPSKTSELVDWVVVVVGTDVVTASEVDLQLRLEAFSNQRPVDNSGAARRQAIERLVEVSLISNEMHTSSFLLAKDEEVERELQALQQQGYLNKNTFSETLKVYSLNEKLLRDFLRQQINVLRFIDFRFRAGLDVNEQTIETYYENVYKKDVERLSGREPEPLAEVYEFLREIILQERVDELLDDWLKLLKSSNRVEYISFTGNISAGRQPSLGK